VTTACLRVDANTRGTDPVTTLSNFTVPKWIAHLPDMRYLVRGSGGGPD